MGVELVFSDNGENGPGRHSSGEKEPRGIMKASQYGKTGFYQQNQWAAGPLDSLI